MPCMCGATDCPSCGPAQGYEVVRRWIKGRWRYVNPEEDDPDEEEPDFSHDADHDADRHTDRHTGETP